MATFVATSRRSLASSGVTVSRLDPSKGDQLEVSTKSVPQGVHGDIRMVTGESADVVRVARRDDAAPEPDRRGDDERIDCVTGVEAVAVPQRPGNASSRPPEGDRSDAAVQHPVDANVRSGASVGLGQHRGGYSNGYVPASRPGEEITEVPGRAQVVKR
jgi:hypothetical protein